MRGDAESTKLFDVEAALFSRILEVLGSNLGRDLSYPDRSSRAFPQSLQANGSIVPQPGNGRFLPNVELLKRR
jgi:hypothetical protein